MFNVYNFVAGCIPTGHPIGTSLRDRIGQTESEGDTTVVDGSVSTDKRIGTSSDEMNEVIDLLLRGRSVDNETPSMVFLPRNTQLDRVHGVILWPNGAPFLADVATTFEHFGLRLVDREPLSLPVEHATESVGIAATCHLFSFDVPDF